MTADQPGPPTSILERSPQLSGAEIVAHLTPPRQFQTATLESYRPDRDYPSQGAAVAAIRNFAAAATTSSKGFFSRRKSPETKPGIYLDGGFGVGKTHLLAALWHLAKGRKYFGTFIEYTALVGALGYAETVKTLRGATLICIDEFELDDPGDTRLMTRLLSELIGSGTRVAATSNTPPNALGEGRFAAIDFLREIDAMAAQFTTLRVDGVDYRHRDRSGNAITLSDEEFAVAVSSVDGVVTVDPFDAVLNHLSSVHPSRYVKLVDGLSAVGFRDVHVLRNQTDALRLVAFVDRLYDAQVRILATGIPIDQVFAEDMLAGGYRKKYLRAVSRMIALTSQDEE
ncbi:MAG TPA: cell division protein ZapE [Homoserinimonas sp.]|nr:cell division protein ZapE [Homoserinimonas sp.]